MEPYLFAIIVLTVVVLIIYVIAKSHPLSGLVRFHMIEVIAGGILVVGSGISFGLSYLIK